MLEDFLKKLGNVMGKTYTPEEFKQIVKEAQNYKPAKEEEKKEEKKK